MTGDIPFRAESAMGIISRHLAEPPDAAQPRAAPTCDIPRRASTRSSLRGLEKNRELRFDDRDRVPRRDRR